jgi:hypothetical protein
MSDVERRQYEFEGGGAVSERQARSRPGWFARLLFFSADTPRG